MSMTLKAARINAGLGLKEAAALIGVSGETLISWEKARTFPDVPKITIIENLYGIKYEHINFMLTNSN